MTAPTDLAPHDAIERVAYRPFELAKAIGLSRSRVYELMNTGELPYRQLGGVRLIPRSAVDALLEGGAGDASTAA